MDKREIQQHLRNNHFRFIKQITDLPDSDFLYSNNGKWTAGQQLDHIVKSVRKVSFSITGFFSKDYFWESQLRL